MNTDPKHLEMLVQAAKSVVETMAMTSCSIEESSFKEGDEYYGVVTGLIGMAGDKSNGTIAISFDKPAILAILNQMLGEKILEINDEVRDAVGELTNMICGDFKRRLSEDGIMVGMATPLIISGKDVHIRDRVTRKPNTVRLQTEYGSFVVETNFASTK